MNLGQGNHLLDPSSSDCRACQVQPFSPVVRPFQVPVNLGKDGYLPDIVAATSDVNVQLVFCNAGYLLTGFFHNRCSAAQGVRACQPVG